MKLKLKLIETWHKAHRYLTVQLAALLALLSTAWEYIPAVQQYLDPAWLKWFALAMIVARLIKQPSVSGEQPTAQPSVPGDASAS